jgi:hypothetical protein
MSEPSWTPRRSGGWVSTWVTTVLGLSAILFVGLRLMLVLGVEDTETFESPLILSVARQLVVGPWELYGPFGGSNPLVLIHAPLYYRAAALLAWPMTAAGLDVVTAARLAGRSLSVLSLLTTLAAAYRLARLGVAPRRAGCWAVLLIAAAPVLGGQSFAVRPDLAGVALQTAGVLLVLEVLGSNQAPGTRLLWAFSSFGLAACVKQHFVMAATLSTFLLLRSCRRSRVGWEAVERGVLVALVIAGAVYGLEGVASEGRIWQAAFVAAGAVGRVHPADWLHVGTVALAVIGKSAGLIALLASAGLAAVGARPGLGWWAFRAGTLLVGSMAALSVGQLALVRPWVTWPLVAALLATLILVIPGCALITRGSMVQGRLDGVLWAYCAIELLLTVVLSRVTDGAWINYAIQAVVFAAVLTARALVRALEGIPSFRPALPAALAAVVVLASALMDIKEVTSRIRAERAAVGEIVARTRRPPSAFFFADRPGLNRVYGRLELVYDDWLYPVFEHAGLAEPRSRWLLRALTSGPVRVVVAESALRRLDAIAQSLPDLGYGSPVQVGSFLVWTR